VSHSSAWRHRWQVVRLFSNGALIATCSHRWEWVAEWCSLLRRDRPGRYFHDYRRTPREEVQATRG